MSASREPTLGPQRFQRSWRRGFSAPSRNALVLLGTLSWVAGAPAAGRDGFDPGVLDAISGEPARTPFPARPPFKVEVPADQREESNQLEEEEGEYRRWLHFWRQRADHTGALPLDETWQYFLEERSRRFASPTSIPAAEWINLGPNTMQGIGGRMLCATFHPTNPETIYAGSNSGGLWWTQNGGTTWEPLAEDLPALAISSVAVNPTNPDQMLIGTGWGWFLGSSAYPGVGVLRSTDAGVTWSKTSFTVPMSAGIGTFDLAWDPLTPGRVHLAANNGYYRSDDGGITWQLRRSGFCTALVLHPQNHDIVYFAFGNDGIYRSSDGGQSFSKLTNGLPAGSQIYLASLAICRDQPNVVFTLMSNATDFCMLGLYRTTDGGTTWSKLTSAPDVMTLPGLGACYGWLFNVVSVSPADPNRILIGGMRVFQTSNGGNTWSQRDYYAMPGSVNPNAGLLYVDNFAFAWHPTNPNRVYGFNDGGAWMSANAGVSWQPRSEGLMTGLFYFFASSVTRPEIVVGGTQDHGLQRLDHSGGNQRWTRWSGGDGEVVRIDHTNDQIVYGVRDGGFHVKSLNGASTWDVNGMAINNGFLEPGGWLLPMVMDPVNPSMLWAATVGRIYKTTNGGALWTPSANVQNVMTLAVDQVNPDIVYAHAYDSSTWQLWRTMNGGVSWTQLTDPSIPGWRVTDLETDPTQSGVVFATRTSAFPGQDHVKRSTDFGVTWTDITADLPDITTSAIAISAKNPAHLYLATDFGVFLSTDTGGSWNEWNDGLPLVYATDIHYLVTDRTVRVATMGRGVWRSRAHDTVVDLGSVPSRDGGITLRIAPNPSRGATRIRFGVPRDGGASVKVFDATGQQLRKLSDEWRSAGDHEVAWDGRNERGGRVPAGVYFVRVTSAGVSRTVRVLRL